MTVPPLHVTQADQVAILVTAEAEELRREKLRSITSIDILGLNGASGNAPGDGNIKPVSPTRQQQRLDPLISSGQRALAGVGSLPTSPLKEQRWQSPLPHHVKDGAPSGATVRGMPEERGGQRSRQRTSETLSAGDVALGTGSAGAAGPGPKVWKQNEDDSGRPPLHNVCESSVAPKRPLRPPPLTIPLPIGKSSVTSSKDADPSSQSQPLKSKSLLMLEMLQDLQAGSTPSAMTPGSVGGSSLFSPADAIKQRQKQRDAAAKVNVPPQPLLVFESSLVSSTKVKGMLNETRAVGDSLRNLEKSILPISQSRKR